MHRTLWLDDLREDKFLYYFDIALIGVFMSIFWLSLTVLSVLLSLALVHNGTWLAAPLPPCIALGIDILHLRYLSWLFSSYTIDESGITVRRLFRKKIYVWSEFQEAGLFSMYRVRSGPYRSFLLLFRSSSSILQSLSRLDDCWLFGWDLIAIRMDDRRRYEYCAASPYRLRIYDYHLLHDRFEPRKDDWDGPPCPRPFEREDWIAYLEREEARREKRRKRP